ncbi:MAG: DUF2802 domain-containing protein [Acidobacteriota bacterium]|nr:DUF2802 domain-containing protein [Acidobacteriota bacterium]
MGALALFSLCSAWMLSRRVRRLESAAKKENESIQAILKMLDSTVERLSGEVREAGERAGVLVEPVAPRSGLNMGKRSQALRLHRHGETADKIASNLDLPRAEVNLLLKIHQLVLKLS